MRAGVVRGWGPWAGSWAAPRPAAVFLTTGADDDVAEAALEEIAAAWRDGYAGMVFDMLRFM